MQKGRVANSYISDRKRAEEHLQVLLREVNHRSKNMLSIVLSVAQQTATASADEFLERFSERIKALAAGQNLIVKSEWKGVEFAELVRSQLAHFEVSFGSIASARKS